jgi:hypothetical protein
MKITFKNKRNEARSLKTIKKLVKQRYAYYTKDMLIDMLINKMTINELIKNPWQIFKPRKRVIYFDVSSPSFPVLSSLSVSNITSSGGRLTAST